MKNKKTWSEMLIKDYYPWKGPIPKYRWECIDEGQNGWMKVGGFPFTIFVATFKDEIYGEKSPDVRIDIYCFNRLIFTHKFRI